MAVSVPQTQSSEWLLFLNQMIRRCENTVINRHCFQLFDQDELWDDVMLWNLRLLKHLVKLRRRDDLTRLIIKEGENKYNKTWNNPTENLHINI